MFGEVRWIEGLKEAVLVTDVSSDVGWFGGVWVYTCLALVFLE